jgi:hypothetical protein
VQPARRAIRDSSAAPSSLASTMVS